VSSFAFTRAGGRAAAVAGQIDDWVHAYLTTSPGANLPMASGLRLQRRWWIGPIPIPLASLTRICGPEPDLPYRVPLEGWEAKTSAIALAEPADLPPLILEYRGTSLALCDGSHRHEALRKRGEEHAWAFVWFNSEKEYLEGRLRLAMAARIGESLRGLLPHLDAARIALTGGVAIGLHLGPHPGDGTMGRPPEDIDLVAAAPDAVRPTVTTDFLVSHFHLPQPGFPKFLIQLVDAVTALRIDVFPDSLGALARAAPADVGGTQVAVVGPGDILDHKLATLEKATPDNLADPKHLEDARRLSAFLQRESPRTPISAVSTPVYSRDIEESCPRCDASRSSAYPLASKRRILDVLGYV
jgi:hypothetical protein